MNGETTGGVSSGASFAGEAAGSSDAGPAQTDATLDASLQLEGSRRQRDAGGSGESADVAKDRAAEALANRAEVPMNNVPPDVDSALNEVANGGQNARTPAGTGEQPSNDSTQVSAEAAQQAQLQEQARVNAYKKITGLGITLDGNSTVDGVIGQIQAKGYVWQNVVATRANIDEAIAHAKAARSEAQSPRTSGSAVAAEVASTDGQPAKAESTTASSEKPLTPEEIVEEIRQLRKENGDMKKVLELVVGRMQQLDNRREAWWKKALAILLLLAKPEFDVAFQSLQEELKAA